MYPVAQRKSLPNAGLTVLSYGIGAGLLISDASS